MMRRVITAAIVYADTENTQLLRAVLGEDLPVLADGVLDRVNKAVGHGPPRLLAEGYRREVIGPLVQLQVQVAAGDDHRLALREQVTAKAHVLVVWLDAQVDEMVAPDRHMADRRILDDCYQPRPCQAGIVPSSDRTGSHGIGIMGGRTWCCGAADQRMAGPGIAMLFG